MQLVPYHNHATSLMVSDYFCELVFCMDFDGTIARAFVHTGQTAPAPAPATNLFIFPTSEFIYFTNVFFYYFMHYFLSLSNFVVQFSAAVDSSVTEQSVVHYSPVFFCLLFLPTSAIHSVFCFIPVAHFIYFAHLSYLSLPFRMYGSDTNSNMLNIKS